MIHRAQFEHWLPVPLERVFPFFANPSNLPRIMPGWMRVRLEGLKIVPPPGMPPDAATVTDQPPFAGARSELEASCRALPGLPFRIRSVARITGFEMNRYFEDIQIQGPFRSWHHRHEFHGETRNGVSGTLIGDQVDYEIGFGVVGEAIRRLFVAPQMRRTFAHRHKEVEKLLR